jgi:hypothetical protein
VICTGAKQVLSLITIYSKNHNFTAIIPSKVRDYYRAFVSKDMTDVSDGLLHQCQHDFFFWNVTHNLLHEVTRTF